MFIPPIYSLLKQFSIYTVFLLLILTVHVAEADIGETYTLKQTRAKVLLEIVQLQKDSISELESTTIDSLKLSVISLDEKIFRSYEESISRITAQKLKKNSYERLAIYLALTTTAAALFFAFLLLIARNRIQKNGYAGLTEMYHQLTMDFISSVSAEKASAHRLLRVNIVVLVGLVMMSVSIVAYLLRTL